MKVVNRAGRIATTERWFVHRGMPQAIVDYSATEDVFTRMAPLLTLIFIAELFLSFGDRFKGFGQFGAFVGSLGIVLVGVVAINKLRGRRPLAAPDDIEAPELVLFVVAPTVIAGIFGEGSLEATVVVVFNLFVLAIGYLVTRFGLVPMIWWGLVQLAKQLSNLLNLLARGLPLLLLFSAFIFLNAEMWQVAHDLTPAFFTVVVTMLFLLAVGFLALRLPAERDQLARFVTWDQVCELAEHSNAPYGFDQRPELLDPPQIDPLTKADRINVFLLLMTSQIVQLVMVALSIGAFYVVFGLFTVREDTLLQWTTIEAEPFDPILTFTLFGSEMILTWELLAVAGFIAAFSGLQFAVSALTDQTYREQFFGQVTHDVREVLAVRALYRTEA